MRSIEVDQRDVIDPPFGHHQNFHAVEQFLGRQEVGRIDIASPMEPSAVALGWRPAETGLTKSKTETRFGLISRSAKARAPSWRLARYPLEKEWSPGDKSCASL